MGTDNLVVSLNFFLPLSGIAFIDFFSSISQSRKSTFLRYWTWISLWLSIGSFFFLPPTLGPRSWSNEDEMPEDPESNRRWRALLSIESWGPGVRRYEKAVHTPSRALCGIGDCALWSVCFSGCSDKLFSMRLNESWFDVLALRTPLTC